jgi:hypothetical protein
VCIIAALAVLLACGSTGPKDYSFSGLWTASGGELNGDTLAVSPHCGDTVTGTFWNGADTGYLNGSNTSGRLRFTIVASSGAPSVVLVFTGHFVNSFTVVSDGSGATNTLTSMAHGGLVPGLDCGS